MAVWFLITRLLIFLLSGMNYSVSSTAETIVPEEVAQKAYQYLNEKLPLYIQQKQPEFTQLLEHIVKNPTRHQPAPSPIQQQPQASVKFLHELPSQNGPLFNPQSYIPHLLTLAKLSSAIKNSDWASEGKDGADSSRKPNKFHTQDKVGSTTLSDHKDIPLHSYGGTHDSTPHFHLSVTIPGAYGHLDKDSSLRPESLKHPSDKMELAKETSTEQNQPVLLHRPGHHHSQLHTHDPILRYHYSQDHHHQPYGLGEHWPNYLFHYGLGHHSHGPGHHGTPDHRPQTPSQWPSAHHGPGHHSTPDHRPQTPSQKPSSHHGPGHYGTTHQKPQTPPQWSSSNHGPGHYGTPHQKPQTPPQWPSSHHSPGHYGTTHQKPQTPPQWSSSNHGPGHYGTPHQKPQTPPQWPRSHHGPGHYGTPHHKPQTPPQWPRSHHGPGYYVTLHHNPQYQPQWPRSHHGLGHHGTVHHKPPTPPQWLIFHAP
ncbi:histidine-rich glycoprotein-like [Melanotaenia boesemani]|uniref:histidine-rich glycoprotein-like n=1 Tax=Melanotaenia boesemani TaxID=1250792 RepID=UPI001C03E88B|nr:histidine-rich glycoprotein-like [Melanotaenia boesemani]XP_041853861.1 histidine-rich glycoprotein-like [Melanotaenia boesemani]